ncbi:MAG: hypothetical protein KC425_26745, partial [Anaerolineales bacterium]|nr:hypothetical protein [Anaerolineales bacterium]
RVPLWQQFGESVRSVGKTAGQKRPFYAILTEDVSVQSLCEKTLPEVSFIETYSGMTFREGERLPENH